MPGPRNRQWVLVERTKDPVNPSAYRWTEGPVPTAGTGQAVVRNLWLSYDPTQIFFVTPDGGPSAIAPGAVVPSYGVAQVVASSREDLAPGDLVWAHIGWSDYSVIEGQGAPAGMPPMETIDPAVDLRLAAGTFGFTGMAAYFGVNAIGRPQRGETLVVSGAAGGVGSIAGQIARLHGLKVIGITGGKEKTERVVRELGFSAAIDYKSEDVGARLTELCPDGIDIYFDNVGDSKLTDTMLVRLRPHGRVVLCGITSIYLLDDYPPGPSHLTSLILQNGRMEGFMARDYVDQYPAARRALGAWIRSGQLRSAEDVIEGLEHAPTTLARLFSGRNFGKQLLHIADPPLPLRGGASRAATPSTRTRTRASKHR
jgi:NADPH-dependent curcumin reductase